MTATCDIPRIKNPSHSQFEDFVVNARPVIVEDALASWKALDQWSPEYFSQKLGGLQVRFKRGHSATHPDLREFDGRRGSLLGIILSGLRSKMNNPLPPQTGTLDEYLQIITTAAERAHYFLPGDDLFIFDQGQWSSALAPLREDFDVPPFIPDGKLDASGVWLSAKGVHSRLHYDTNGCHNLNAQVKGEKRVRMFSPQQMDSVYPYLYTKLSAYNFSQIDLDSVDIDRFPKFNDALCHVGMLGPGDMLFIPAYWFHSFVHSGEFNANINFWWQPNFTHMSPVAVRAAVGYAVQMVTMKAKVPPLGMLKWAGRIEEQLIKNERFN